MTNIATNIIISVMVSCTNMPTSTPGERLVWGPGFVQTWVKDGPGTGLNRVPRVVLPVEPQPYPGQ